MSLLDYPLSNPPKIQSYTPAPRNLFRSAVINLNKFRFRKKHNSPFISGDSIASLTDYYVYGESGNENLDIELIKAIDSLIHQTINKNCKYLLISDNNKLKLFCDDYLEKLKKCIL
jgi:hypothetical protein